MSISDTFFILTLILRTVMGLDGIHTRLVPRNNNYCNKAFLNLYAQGRSKTKKELIILFLGHFPLKNSKIN